MRYQKKYPLADSKNEHILLVWDAGYKNVEIYFKNRLIQTIPNPSVIKKGFTFLDHEVGEIVLTFSERPMAVNVVVNGYHSPKNLSHPANKIKTTSRIFWAIAGTNFMILLITVFSNWEYIAFLINLILVGLLSNAVYVVAAIFVAKAKVWAFWVGAGYFWLNALWITLNSLNQFFIIEFFVLAYNVIVTIALIYSVKTAISLLKHSRLNLHPVSNDELLDDGM